MFQFIPRNRNSSGTILVSVLWVLVILTVLTVSLGHSTHIEFFIVKNTVAKAQSKYLAWAGVTHAIKQIRKDSQDAATGTQDTLYQCGIRLDEGTLTQNLFKNRSLGDGFFDVQYTAANKIYYGLQDEERRININALVQDNAGILNILIVNLGFDEQTAQTIAYSILDWKDEDHDIVDRNFGAEDGYYQSLSKTYRAKNRPFDTLEELFLVRGMTPKIFESLKDYITVYPKQGILRINFDTASKEVLTALALWVEKMLPDTAAGDAQSLVEKISRYRQGEDGVEFTPDDRQVDLNQMLLNAVERNIFLAMTQFRTLTSDYFRIHAKGTQKGRGAVSWIEAIVYRRDLSILSWHRN